MAKMVESPKKCIVSCRIDDREMESLKEMARKNGTSISGLLRQSLDRLSCHTFQAQA